MYIMIYTQSLNSWWSCIAIQEQRENTEGILTTSQDLHAHFILYFNIIIFLLSHFVSFIINCNRSLGFRTFNYLQTHTRHYGRRLDVGAATFLISFVRRISTAWQGPFQGINWWKDRYAASLPNSERFRIRRHGQLRLGQRQAVVGGIDALGWRPG